MRFAQGKILKGVGGKYEVLCGDTRYAARARGVFRHDGISPQVGDNVTLRIEETGEHYIDSIAERKNLLIRPPMANLDYMLITAAAAKPAPVPETLDKLSAVCVHNAITPIFVITKCDLDRAGGEELAALYRKAGFDAFTLSKDDEDAAKELHAYLSDRLAGHTAAFAGASGIGKSTLLNRLFPALSLATGEISKKISRGRHTTRHVELFPVYGGFLADTPGFGMLDFLHFDFMELCDLADAFPEFAPYLGRCRYKGCTHLCEDGCAVVEAVARGEIAPSRHESYRALYRTLKDKHAWTKVPH
ncbi:MAG: ribosome small subunit-dependent GTPase A [Clostridia bacterium]|nr:ribosome small subunit-dependent GTPase A [Clostridia bacterium]